MKYGFLFLVLSGILTHWAYRIGGAGWLLVWPASIKTKPRGDAFDMCVSRLNIAVTTG